MNFLKVLPAIYFYFVHVEFGNQMKIYSIECEGEYNVQTELPKAKRISVLEPMERCIREISVHLREVQEKCDSLFSDLL